jgi:hypothetical protein
VRIDAVLEPDGNIPLRYARRQRLGQSRERFTGNFARSSDPVQLVIVQDRANLGERIRHVDQRGVGHHRSQDRPDR